MKLRFLLAALGCLAPVAAHAVSPLEIQANSVYRDYVTDGVPTSGTWNPSKNEIRGLWQQLANGLPNLSSNVQGTTSMPGLDGGKWMIYDNVTANSGVFNAPTLRITRRANYTGGAGVTNAIWADCNNGANTGVFEWCTLSAIDNFATGSGTNTVALYGQIRRNTNAGPSWAGTWEARDVSGQINPTSELVGGEVDIFAAGTDTNKERHAITIVLGRNNSSTDPTVHAADAISIGPSFPNDTGGTAIWDTLIVATGYAGNGLDLSTVNFTGDAIKTPGLTISNAGNVWAASYGVGGSFAGVDCLSGVTAGTVVVHKGIVTHC